MDQPRWRKLFRYQILVSLELASLILTSLSPAWAQQHLLTQRTEILYLNSADLREMEKRLRFTPLDHFYQSYFYTQDPALVRLTSQLAAKVDGLLVKVCLILKKWPRESDRLRIILLPDGNQVRSRYLALQPFLPSFSMGHGPLEAFYEHTTRTNFLSSADLHNRILAHEMTHFVLCHAYDACLPPGLAEEWAQYVEDKID